MLFTVSNEPICVAEKNLLVRKKWTIVLITPGTCPVQYITLDNLFLKNWLNLFHKP